MPLRRERQRQALRGPGALAGLSREELKAERERQRVAAAEDRERRKVEAAAAKRYPVDDTELLVEAAARAAERGGYRAWMGGRICGKSVPCIHFRRHHLLLLNRAQCHSP